MYKYINKYGVSRSRVIDYVVGEKPFSFGTNHAANAGDHKGLQRRAACNDWETCPHAINAGDHEGRPYSVKRRVTIRNLSTRRY